MANDLIILWSPEAEKTYLRTIEFILENWSVQIAQEFETMVENLLIKLKKHKKLCPSSIQFKSLRKCHISKQTSLVYRINKNTIELITFIDNRSNHQF